MGFRGLFKLICVKRPLDEGVRESGCRGMDSGCLDMRGVNVLEVSRREWKDRDLITYDL